MSSVAIVMAEEHNPGDERRAYRDQARTAAQRQWGAASCMFLATDFTHGGPAVARNRVLRLLPEHVRWVLFADDDDLLEPHAVAALLAHAGTTRADVIWPRFRVIGDAAGSRRRSLGDLLALTDRVAQHRGCECVLDKADTDFAGALRAQNFIPVTALVRRSAGDAVGWFPEGDDAPRHPVAPHPRLEDWGLWLRLLDAGASFAHLPEVLWSWRQWAGSLTGRMTDAGTVEG
jgi:hypothetical protein